MTPRSHSAPGRAVNRPCRSPLAKGVLLPPSLSRWRAAARIVLLAASCAIGGCSLFVPPPEVRGNRVDPDELAQLVPGTSTRADVTSLLGSPTAQSTFGDDNWYYITETTRPVIGGTQTVLDQHVVVLSFNQQGVLTAVHKIGPKDALPAPIVARTTPSPGTSAGFFQQLLGNVGRVGPNLGQSDAAPGGGAPVR